ncbi:multidrug resistance-associated ABC transporter [Peniophora sp. CONT]|nr:multidrug resistance-associated ABC transporter [Peniophora sp. CONT]
MEYQVVLKAFETAFTFDYHYPVPLWRDARILPAYAAGISVLGLVAHSIAVLVHRRAKKDGEENAQPVEQQDTSAVGVSSSLRSHVAEHGGATIFAYKVARFVSVLALLALYVASFVHDYEIVGSPDVGALGKKKKARKAAELSRREWVDLILCITYLYASFLSLVTITAKGRIARAISPHLSLVLIVGFGVYAYRDLWPLLTFTLAPADRHEGALLWAKVALITYSAVLVPLSMPREYVALDSTDPQPEANPEQTTNIISLTTYTFLDKYIFQAYSQGRLEYEQLPPLADYDYTKNLVKRSFKHLDMFSGAPNQHMFIALMKVFFWEYMVLTLMMIFRVLTAFLAPVGINRLLNYIEKGGEDAMVRPWVWISLMFFGPFVGTIVMQWYIFTTTGSLVRAQAIITQLVFEHSLRIRMKAETAASTPSPSTAVTPDTASLADTAVGTEGTEGGHSTEGTEQTLLPSSASVTSSTSGKGKGKAKDEDDDKKDKDGNLVGKINNLVATDLENIVEGRDFLLLVLYSPLQCAICVYFLYLLLGWSSFVGMGIMVVCFPLPGWIASKMQAIQKTAMKKTDARVQNVTEMMSVLRMVKLFGWETKMADMLAKKRDEELEWIMSKELVGLANNVVNYFIPILQMIGTYASFTLIMKGKLTPSLVFSSMAVFDLLRDQLHTVFFMIQPTIQAKVSLDRISDFLRKTELLDHYASQLKDEPTPTTITDAARFDKSIIGFQDASFTWSDDDATSDGTLTPSRRKFCLRIFDELVFKKGAINLIIGPTGSGKTSLLMALLGEMHFKPMTPGSWFNLPRTGGVAYAAQESWVQNETIRDNILFGAPFDEDRYNKVIYQCGLKRDLTLFEAGDKTEVGEKGLTLSGGQKARITLARAIYSSAETLLLDDVLAALDVHTARWIVDKCFKGDLVRGRTVLLVTHNVAMASPIAHYVVSLGTDGQILSRGSVSDAMAKDENLAHEVEEEAQIIEKTETEVVDNEEPDATAKQADGKLIVAEEVAEGHISWTALRIFFSALGGKHSLAFWFFFTVGLGLSDVFTSLQTFWMGAWAEAYDKTERYEDVDVKYYLGIFTVFVALGCVTYTVGVTVYVFGIIRAARKIHRELIHSILGTTLRWLDTTPTSRVITRCTQDIRTTDGPFAHLFQFLSEVSITMAIKLISIVIVTPIFLIPGVIVFLVGGYCGQIYMSAQLSVKREMSNKRAPVLGHFGAAIAGLTSIRAYGAEDAFRAEAYKRIDQYSRAGRTFYNLNRWISTRIDALGGMFAAGLGAYLVYGPGSRDALPSNVGFAMNMAVGFSGMILWWVRIYNDFEVQGNSLERIQAYMVIEQEPKPTQEKIPPASWPTSGDLRVEKLSARYSPDGPRVLHEVSFEIKSGERVGIVGRTGSGKSSLTLSLLRCIFNEGSVFYDGIDTADINLDTLRSSITIIPQVPELLSGTLRENLDPFSEHDDAVLNSALRAAGLFSLQKDEDDNRISLESQISSGGGNLSVGQRQILALARALVRGSKLLILDEATSSIDYETDTIIQASLRNELGGDVTLLTVAHRLQTIMDADKIMVLDAGRIVEFDAPSVLLKKEGGFLKSLVDESGDKDALYAMAEGKKASSS